MGGIARGFGLGGGVARLAGGPEIRDWRSGGTEGSMMKGDEEAKKGRKEEVVMGYLID